MEFDCGAEANSIGKDPHFNRQFQDTDSHMQVPVMMGPPYNLETVTRNTLVKTEEQMP